MITHENLRRAILSCSDPWACPYDSDKPCGMSCDDCTDKRLTEYENTIRENVLEEVKLKWDSRVTDLIKWCKDGRLVGLKQADLIFAEILEQMKGEQT